MKALRFYDVQDLRYEDAPDPVIEKPDDVIVKVKQSESVVPILQDTETLDHMYQEIYGDMNFAVRLLKSEKVLRI